MEAPVRMVSMRNHLILVSLLALSGALTLHAQEPASPPRLVLNPSGPLGAVRWLVFAPDSDRFYEGGDDKVVREWGVRNERGSLSLAMQRTYRWEIARGPRGVVHAATVSPDGRMLAFGGLSARESNGDVVVVDLKTGEFKRVLRSHRQTVDGLSFSPNGKHLASASVDGELRLWDTNSWSDTLLRPASSTTLPYCPVAFLSDTLVVAPDWRTPERIAVYDTSKENPRPYVLPDSHSGAVQVLAHDKHSGQWASADAKGGVKLWRGWQSRSLLSGPPATALSFAPGNRLFLTAEYNPVTGFSVMEMWDWRSAQKIDDRTLARELHSYACAVSGDGDYVAAYSGDHSELLLFPLKDAAGKPLAKPLSTGQPIRRSGGGDKIWKVAFDTASAYKLGFGVNFEHATSTFNDYGQIQRSFDFERLRLADAAKETQWIDPAANRDGWTATPSRDRTALTLARLGTTAGTIVLDKKRQGVAECYAWINDKAGKPYALAVGTTEPVNGVYIYGLPLAGRTAPLLRYYRDHADRVTSIGVSPDGKYLASGSADQTIKVWSLAGLAPGAGAGMITAFGAKFEIQNDDVVATAVDKAGIAYGRGIRVGDSVAALRYDQQGTLGVASKSPQILAVLQQKAATPWETLILAIKTPGERKLKHTLLKPAWEPLLNLFSDRQGEWACWTPQGYFYEASVHGDQLFGWQFNDGWDRPPRFFEAAQFRKKLERPEVIRKLLTAGNAVDALAAAGVEDPDEAADYVLTLSREAPELALLSPQANAEFGEKQSVEIKAEVKVIDEQDADHYVATCHINGAPLADPEVVRDGRSTFYTWRTLPTSELNRIRVSVSEKDNPPGGFYQDADVFIRATPNRTTTPKLHLVTLAAQEYPGKLSLTYPVADAAGIVKALMLDGGEVYEPGASKALLNKQITRDSVSGLIDEMQTSLKEASPEDVLVVFIAGHGISYDGDYYFVPPFESDNDQLTEDPVRENGISWRLLRRLMSIPCRKLFLLDTCFSGNIIFNERDPVYHWKAAIRPLARDEVVVLSATSPGEFSYEPEPSQAEKLGIRNGIFTHCVLSGLSGAADGAAAAHDTKNTRIEIDELVEYVRREANRLAPLQRPSSTPTADLGFVPLSEYK